MSESNVTRPVVCYLICPKQKTAFVGAVLIADGTARPLHFAYAAPVQPTAMQRILYGRTLDEHVRVDVIAKQLLADLPPHLEVMFIFVDSEDLLSVQRVTACPVATIIKGDSDKDTAFHVQGLEQHRDALEQLQHDLVPGVDYVEPFSRLAEALKETSKLS